MLSSSPRSFSSSLPSADFQLPSNSSCTFRVGADVIGTSYWQAVKAREQRPIATPTTGAKRGSINSRSLARLRQPAFVEIDEVWNALDIVAMCDSRFLFSLFETWCNRIAPTEFRRESV